MQEMRKIKILDLRVFENESRPTRAPIYSALITFSDGQTLEINDVRSNYKNILCFAERAKTISYRHLASKNGLKAKQILKNKPQSPRASSLRGDSMISIM